MGPCGMVETSVRLRPFEEADLAVLVRYATDPAFSSPFEWDGYRSPAAVRRRWEDDGLLGKDPHQLVVANADGTVLGWVMWLDPNLFGRQGWAWETGSCWPPSTEGEAPVRLRSACSSVTCSTPRSCTACALTPKPTTWPSRGRSRSAGSVAKVSCVRPASAAADGATSSPTQSSGATSMQRTTTDPTSG